MESHDPSVTSERGRWLSQAVTSVAVHGGSFLGSNGVASAQGGGNQWSPEQLLGRSATGTEPDRRSRSRTACYCKSPAASSSLALGSYLRMSSTQAVSIRSFKERWQNQRHDKRITVKCHGVCL